MVGIEVGLGAEQRRLRNGNLDYSGGKKLVKLVRSICAIKGTRSEATRQASVLTSDGDEVVGLYSCSVCSTWGKVQKSVKVEEVRLTNAVPFARKHCTSIGDKQGSEEHQIGI